MVGPVAWIFRLAAPDGDDLAALVSYLEARLAERGGRRVVAFSPNSNARGELERRDYQSLDGELYLERSLPDRIVAGTALSDVGGRVIPPGLWDELRGMEEAKEIIERRVILPLERPELAGRHGVVSPKAIILFGPPGTGKTTFAKGIASRLQLAVRRDPAGRDRRRGGRAPGQAPAGEPLPGRVPRGRGRLRRRGRGPGLDAPRRRGSVGPSVTNEFLKQIPRLREAPHHLLVCATNWVSRLDGAFLRPGRFDYVLPVGPPDAGGARGDLVRATSTRSPTRRSPSTSSWRRASCSRPADIEFSARKALSAAFEREHFGGAQSRATTEDFLAAIRATKPSLTPEIIAQFEDDTQRFARD